MKTRAPASSHKTLSSQGINQDQSHVDSMPHFLDNRSEVASLYATQAIMNSSSQVQQLKSMQALASDHSKHFNVSHRQSLPHKTQHVIQQEQSRANPTIQLHQNTSTQIHLSQPHLTNTSVIQREVDVGVVQIELNSGTQLISNSHISTNNRPEGSMKGQEGSHTTAWVVTVEGIRQAVQGKTIQQAITAIDTLYALINILPGAQDDRIDAMSVERQEKVREARQLTIDAKATAQANATLENLQSYIGCLMAYRNSVPLSAAKRGANADSGAEAQAMAILRNYVVETPAAIRGAIFKLLDKKAIDDYQANVEFEEDQSSDVDRDVSYDNPGAIEGEDVNNRVKNIVEQHLMWVEGLFPAAYAKANITETLLLNTFLFPQGNDDISFGSRDKFVGFIDIPARAAHPVAPLAMTANDSFATQVVLDATGNVDMVWVSGRPDGVFGAQDRKHVTAWTLLVNGVINRVSGTSINQSITGMRNLLGEAKALPGAQTSQKNALSDAAFNRYTAALLAADNASVAANAAVTGGLNNQIKHSALQNLIHNYLAFRNAMALTAAIIPGQLSTAGGKAESRKIATLDEFELSGKRTSPKIERASALLAMWGLLDFGAVKIATDDAQAQKDFDIAKNSRGVDYNINMPGVDITKTFRERVANIVVQHLKTIASSYPRSFHILKNGLSNSLEKIFNDKLGNRFPKTANLIRILMRWPKKK